MTLQEWVLWAAEPFRVSGPAGYALSFFAVSCVFDMAWHKRWKLTSQQLGWSVVLGAAWPLTLIYVVAFPVALVLAACVVGFVRFGQAIADKVRR